MTTLFETGEFRRELRQMSREIRAITDAARHALRIQRAETCLARVTATMNQLERKFERGFLAESNPNDPRLKRRLPQICKTMTGPSDGADFLARAAAALRSGGDDGLQRFARVERAAGRLE